MNKITNTTRRIFGPYYQGRPTMARGNLLTIWSPFRIERILSSGAIGAPGKALRRTA